MKVALLTTIAFICSFVLITPPDWHVGDDSTIAMVLNGMGWSDKPSEYVPFINIYLCKMIKWFAEHWPQWFWYSFFVVGFTALSLFQILLIVFDEKRSVSFLLAALGLVFFVYFPLFISISFTKTAISLGVSSLFLLLNVNLRNHAGHIKFKNILGVLGFVLASLLRFNGAIMALALCIPWILFSMVNKKALSRRRSLALALFVLGVFSLSFYFLHLREYAKILDWAHYMSSAKILSYFMDYYRDFTSPEMMKKLSLLGIDDLDVKLIRNWMISEDVLTNEQLLKMKEIIPPPKTTFFEGIWIVLRWSFYKQATIILLTISFGIFWACGKKRECLLLWTWSFLLAVYLRVFMKLPSRIFEPLLGTMLLAPLVVWAKPKTQGFNRRWVLALLFVLILKVNVSEVRYMKYLTRESHLKKASYLEDLVQLNQTTQHILYWLYNDFIELPVFQSPQLQLKSFKLLGFGWFGRTGLQKQRMRQLGVNTVFEGLLKEKGAVVVARPEIQPLLREVIQNKYGVEQIEFREVYDGQVLKAFDCLPERKEGPGL